MSVKNLEKIGPDRLYHLNFFEIFSDAFCRLDRNILSVILFVVGFTRANPEWARGTGG